jgi:tRNA A22 N-methylase
MLQAAQHNTKQFNIIGINQKYYNLFAESFSGRHASFQQYKVHIGDFLEKLGNKDFATITSQDIENYVNAWDSGEKTKANCKAHIRSMLIYAIKENIENAVDKVSKKMLVWLI